MRLRWGTSLAAASLGVLVAVTLSTDAYAGLLTEGPPITDVSVSHVTKNSATLTAVINPEGTETEYKVELRYKEICGKKHCKGKTIYRTAGTGTLPARVDQERRVTIHASKLKPNTRYFAYFSATNESATTEVEEGKEFTTK
jgi:hypothetical protein